MKVVIRGGWLGGFVDIGTKKVVPIGAGCGVSDCGVIKIKRIDRVNEGAVFRRKYEE